MRIAFFVNKFPFPSETFILNQITGLIDRGHEVDIFPRCGPPDVPLVHPDVARYGLLGRTHYPLARCRSRLKRFCQRTAFSLRCLLSAPGALSRGRASARRWEEEISELKRPMYAMASVIGKGPYDVVHAHYGYVGMIAAWLRDAGAIEGEIVMSFPGWALTIERLTRGREYFDRLFSAARLYICCSDFMLRRARELGADEAKLRKMPFGLDMSRFRFSERRVAPGDEIRFLTVARFAEMKGHEYSIRAFAEIAAKHPDARYLLVGDGPLRAQLEGLSRELGVGDRVEFLGWRTHEEVAELMAQAHVFVLSSVVGESGDEETQGLVLMEAQASGLPVVSTLTDAITEGVLDGESGFLVPERDAAALAERLRHLIEHPELWPEMGRAGRAFVEQKYDIEKLNDQLVGIYEEALST